MRPSISVAIAGLLCFSAYVSAQPNKQSYELEERCGKRAAEAFEREYGPVSDDKNEQTLFNYENHYSARLKKCFFLEIAISYEHEEGKPASKIMRPFDLNENKEYGTFVSGPTESTPVTCVVRGKHCVAPIHFVGAAIQAARCRLLAHRQSMSHKSASRSEGRKLADGCFHYRRSFDIPSVCRTGARTRLDEWQRSLATVHRSLFGSPCSCK